MPDTTITINALRRIGRGPHRIEWFGPVHRKRGVSSGPFTHIEVALRSIANDLAAHEAGTDGRHSPIIRSVPISLLRLFRIGDVWSNGHRTGKSTLPRMTLERVTVNKDTCEIRPIGLPANFPSGRRYPVPFEHFNWHKPYTGSFCVKIEANERLTLLVPCVELIRFYLASSGLLIQRLFTPLVNRKLYTYRRYSEKDGTAFIRLSTGLIGPAAPTVARIAFDTAAARAASCILNSCQAASYNGVNVHPKGLFPFDGETTLTVRGIELPSSKGRRLVLATTLEQCTHPFPFQRLFYESNLGQRPLQNRNDGVPNKKLLDARQNQRAEVVINDDGARVDIAPVIIEATSSEIAFPDLDAKQIMRVKLDHGRKSSGSGRGDSTTGVSLGADGTIGEARPVEFTGADTDPEIRELLPEALVAFMDATKVLRGYGYQTRPVIFLNERGRRPRSILKIEDIVSGGDGLPWRELMCAELYRGQFSGTMVALTGRRILMPDDAALTLSMQRETNLQDMGAVRGLISALVDSKARGKPPRNVRHIVSGKVENYKILAEELRTMIGF